ncbi:MAG: hypothetical protein J7M32_01535 [Deltaproteobacteria bacterium]|nr:hypothetical protein [Deltaproteobacteria bacterium]
MTAASNHDRLPLHFHQTFIPERHYIAALLRYAAGGPRGKPLKEISLITGIPMGESSGKMPAILDYCRGMGLIYVKEGGNGGPKELRLTPLGRSVVIEDPHLSEGITQLLCHMNLCRSDFGADLWFMVFNAGSRILGDCFSEQTLLKYLEGIYGRKKRSPIGPLLRVYTEYTALEKSGVLRQSGHEIQRIPFSLRDIYVRGYGAWLISQFQAHFPKSRQVTTDDFEKAVGLKNIALWSQEDYEEFLFAVERKGLISVDRQMRPFVIMIKVDSVTAWDSVYSDLV